MVPCGPFWSVKRPDVHGTARTYKHRVITSASVKGPDVHGTATNTESCARMRSCNIDPAGKAGTRLHEMASVPFTSRLQSAGDATASGDLTSLLAAWGAVSAAPSAGSTASVPQSSVHTLALPGASAQQTPALTAMAVHRGHDSALSIVPQHVASASSALAPSSALAQASAPALLVSSSSGSSLAGASAASLLQQLLSELQRPNPQQESNAPVQAQLHSQQLQQLLVQQQRVKELKQALAASQVVHAQLASRTCASAASPGFSSVGTSLTTANGSIPGLARSISDPTSLASGSIPGLAHSISDPTSLASGNYCGKSSSGSQRPPNGLTMNGQWITRDQLLHIYSLRSKKTCGNSSIDQAAAGRSMVVAGIYSLPPKTIRDIWARKVGAEWTAAEWTDRERHMHARENGIESPLDATDLHAPARATKRKSRTASVEDDLLAQASRRGHF